MFFQLLKEPSNQICCQIFKILKLFLKICVQFQAFKNLYPPRSRKTYENLKNFEKKSFGFRKKNFGSNTDTEIGLWFQLPIPKPNFGRTLIPDESPKILDSPPVLLHTVHIVVYKSSRRCVCQTLVLQQAMQESKE